MRTTPFYGFYGDDFTGSRGWATISLEPWNWFREMDEEELLRPVVLRVLELLEDNRSVVLFTCEGPDDEAIARTREAARLQAWEDPRHRIGILQGRALRVIMEAKPLPGMCVAGGDTSGYVNRELDIYGLEICLKGGPLGTECYFENIGMGQKQD